MNTDIRVRHLQAQIADWQTCPTTDPATKKSKVARLESELSSVENGLRSAPDSGSAIDITAYSGREQTVVFPRNVAL